MILSPGCRPGARFTGFQGGDNSLGLAWQHGDKVATSWRQNEVNPSKTVDLLVTRGAIAGDRLTRLCCRHRSLLPWRQALLWGCW